MVGVARNRAKQHFRNVDLRDRDAVGRLVAETQPDVVLHLAAERRPDVVQNDPSAARALNVDAVGALAESCAALPSPAYMVNVSTDYVFDGESPPYQVDDECQPLNAYGQSKRDGELQLLAKAEKGYATNLRVPVLYGETEYLGESAVNVLLGILQNKGQRAQIDAVAVRYPTCVTDVARVLMDLVSLFDARRTEGGSPGMPPILHFTAQEPMTKYDMCLVMSRAWNRATQEGALSTDHLDPQFEDDPAAVTHRPRNCKLDTSATTALGIDVQCNAFAEWWTSYFARSSTPDKVPHFLPSDGEKPPHTWPMSQREVPASDAAGGSDTVSDASHVPTHAPQEDSHAITGALDKKGTTESTSALKQSPSLFSEDGAATVSKIADSDTAPARSAGTAQDNGCESHKVPDTSTLADDDAMYGPPTPNKEHTMKTSAPPSQPAYTFHVSVADPHRVGDPVTAHVVYAVHIMSNAPWLSRPDMTILRRYSDFRWLHAALVSNHPGVIVPPVPEKVKVGRFDPDVVEFRRRALERALQKMLEHPRLQRDDDLLLFLESAQFASDLHARDARKGRVITPDYKAYFGWSQTLQQYRYHEQDSWFDRQLEYLAQLETRVKDIVSAISVLSQKRIALAKAQNQLYGALVALSSSNLSRSVSTCFAALADVKKHMADTSWSLADHEANILGLVMYEYERLVGSIRKTFSAREDVWQAWQKTDDELGKLRSKLSKQREAHADMLGHVLTKAELASAAHRTRFEEVSRLCKTELERFEKEKVQEIRSALEAYVHRIEELQRDSLDTWNHCQSVIQRHMNASAAPEEACPQEGREKPPAETPTSAASNRAEHAAGDAQTD